MMTLETKTIHSPQLNRSRTLRILLPKDYHSTQRNYPVLYMQDGQNLFEARTAAFRHWKLDSIMQKQPLHRQVIIVGIDHGGIYRLHEYAPFKRGRHGGQGDLYMRFLIETVKQFVDKTYRTKPFREDTAIAGSSMGGLIALYGGLRYGQYFGKVGAFSPSLWFNPSVLDLTTKTAWKSKIYAVSSKTEMKSVEKTMHNVYWSLKKGNYSDEQLRIILRDRGKHNEIFWSKEFKKMMEWMF
ncbi:MAG: alpha/beta hydrolase [Saprospiraceae bacterium]